MPDIFVVSEICTCQSVLSVPFVWFALLLSAVLGCRHQARARVQELCDNKRFVRADDMKHNVMQVVYIWLNTPGSVIGPFMDGWLGPSPD